MPTRPLEETAQAVSRTAVLEAAASGRMLVQHLSPGWGSSGYYSSEVLEQAVADNVIPAGTQMFADHPTAEEAQARPVRSIKDLMSITTEPARIATTDDVARGADLGSLVSEVDIVPTYRPLLAHLAEHIGVSIRGDGELVPGEAEGRTGTIVESLVHVKSVDWVTRAGRGGKVVQLLESAAADHDANTAAVRRGVAEATVNDTREALQVALRDAYGLERVGQTPPTWVWVRDFDDTRVWFEIDGPTASSNGLFEQTYTQDTADAVSLTGDRTEVRVRTTYVPVARPGSTTTTEESQEDTMPNIEEARLRQLEADAGRVTVLESERDTALAERDTARGELATIRRANRAITLVNEAAAEANVDFTRLEVRGITASLPLTEAGDFDEAAFTTSLAEHIAEKRSAGAGVVIGHGSRTTSAPVAEAGSHLAAIDRALGIKKES
ncbi:hypothetical protein [Nocardioides bruguierae]|uniref:hypothetical protein n=1 Tax=Nocardioides bruguierae TaxID=2945102 RepID=UPI002021632F|nr:hypothetical protein [Nocardioides bruguierae]MCL8026320.1 hypothetical protein [Nocardioides bruguierae]